ncbi:MAG TPA: hypothetical protein VND19_21465 [Acetobacteraceae bacterium]|nr:hypothetical protein [Acetobacteraceae bacterium]
MIGVVVVAGHIGRGTCHRLPAEPRQRAKARNPGAAGRIPTIARAASGWVKCRVAAAGTVAWLQLPAWLAFMVVLP